jgi:hypothetical protein
MIKREAKLQEKFGRWLKAVYLEQYAGGLFELKQTTTDSLSFSSVKLHQEQSLHNVKHGKFYYKIPDDSIGVKPCDCVALAGMDAYIVVGYPKGTVMIDIDAWCKEKKASERKSLTFSRAKVIGELIF